MMVTGVLFALGTLPEAPALAMLGHLARNEAGKYHLLYVFKNGVRSQNECGELAIAQDAGRLRTKETEAVIRKSTHDAYAFHRLILHPNRCLVFAVSWAVFAELLDWHTVALVIQPQCMI